MLPKLQVLKGLAVQCLRERNNHGMKSNNRIDNHTFSTQHLEVLYNGELRTEALTYRIHGYCKAGAQPQATRDFYPMMFMPIHRLLQASLSACFTLYLTPHLCANQAIFLVTFWGRTPDRAGRGLFQAGRRVL
jgi:hypothetical protein